MGNFEKLSVLVIVVIIVMILVVAIYEWSGSPTEPAPTSEPVVAGPEIGKGLSSSDAVGPRSTGRHMASTGGKKPDALDPDDLFKLWSDPKSGPGSTLEKPGVSDEPIGKPVEPKPAPPAANEIPETTHVVAAGESLSEISKKYYARASLWPKIADANPGLDPVRMRTGQKLKIPALKIEAPLPPGINAAPGLAGGDRPVPGKEYTVKASDTWERIAKAAYNSADRWPEIYVKNINLVDRRDQLRGGLVISIPK